MANDNLSGLIVTALLARELINGKKPNRSWRILFLPETIGAIAYLHENQPRMENVLGGLVATCCGGPGPLGYKESYLGDHLVDRAIRLAFRDQGVDPVCYPFAPDGSDERQYSSPGFRIPVASITKDKYYEYEEYHTSLDNLEFVEAKNVVETYEIYREVAKVLDSNVQIESTMQYGEAQLGKRNLYPTLGGMINQNSIRNQNDNGIEKQVDAMSWLLFLGDGNTDIISVSERSKINYEVICKALEKLKTAGLIAI
jgi:aminopeptidase-like protein